MMYAGYTLCPSAIILVPWFTTATVSVSVISSQAGGRDVGHITFVPYGPIIIPT